MALLFFFPAQLQSVRGKVVRGSGASDDVLGGAWSNGYSVTVSAEGHCLVNERMFHHQVVLGVLRDPGALDLKKRDSYYRCACTPCVNDNKQLSASPQHYLSIGQCSKSF